MTERNSKKHSKPRKLSGNFHKIKGGLKESLGRTFGARGMRQSGAEERVAGHAECQAAMGHGSYLHGTKERVAGKKDKVLGSITGDHAQEDKGDMRQAQGVAQQTWTRRT